AMGEFHSVLLHHASPRAGARAPGLVLYRQSRRLASQYIQGQFGKIGYLNEVLSAYRVHAAGAWSLGKRSRQLIISMKILDNIDKDLGFKYSATIRQAQARFLFELAEFYLQSGHARFALVPVK